MLVVTTNGPSWGMRQVASSTFLATTAVLVLSIALM
jgi:hypothetical protein